MPQPGQPSLHEGISHAGATCLGQHIDVQVRRPTRILELSAVGSPRIPDSTVSHTARAKKGVSRGRSTNQCWRMARAIRSLSLGKAELSMQPVRYPVSSPSTTETNSESGSSSM